MMICSPHVYVGGEQEYRPLRRLIKEVAFWPSPRIFTLYFSEAFIYVLESLSSRSISVEDGAFA